MEDFEKNRIEYVGRLEQNVKNLQEQLQALQADERWTPKIGSDMSEKDKARITLHFGGKAQTAIFSYDFLRDQSVTDATTAIIEQGFQNLINDRIREALLPEVKRLKDGVDSITTAGKW